MLQPARSAGRVAGRAASATDDPGQPSQADRRRKGARPRGDRYTRHSYRQSVRRACVRAGVPEFNPYEVRHLFAVRVDATLGFGHAQASMGHSSPQPARRYSKQSFAKAAEVAKELG